jgi:hypothetical protein
MSRRQAIETSLGAWRDAERRLTHAVDAEREAPTRDVERHRAEHQQHATDHMVERIGSLQEAENRRSHATPSTPPFHEAARDTQDIASDIWEAARQSDEATPQTLENQRSTPRSSAPGSADVTEVGRR